jgi:hypothetical protein
MARKTVKKPPTTRIRPRKQGPNVTALNELLKDLRQRGWHVATKEESDRLMGIQREYSEPANSMHLGVAERSSASCLDVPKTVATPKPTSLPDMARAAHGVSASTQDRLYELAKALCGEKEIANEGPTQGFPDEGIAGEYRYTFSRIIERNRYMNDLLDIIANKVL